MLIGNNSNNINGPMRTQTTHLSTLNVFLIQACISQDPILCSSSTRSPSHVW